MDVLIQHRAPAARTAMSEREIALLTGGGDRPYALGLARALVASGIRVDFIGSDDLESAELRASPRLRFLNLRGSQAEDVSLPRKGARVLAYYARLLAYAWRAKPAVFHILWNNKFEYVDRTLLMLYYRLCGKRIALTAHNVNAGRRDGNDSRLNRLTLRAQYHLADHVFVHTAAMKRELCEDFAVPEGSVTVIPLGFNNAVPQTDLTAAAARQRLGVDEGDRTILFFGRMNRYKGLDILVAAFERLVARDRRYRLVIAGKPEPGYEGGLADIQRALGSGDLRDRVIQRIGFVPDADTEVYFKAADVVALPYTEVFQSGVLVLGYSFGLPVIAADVGSFREDVVEGATGLLCRPRDPGDLARAVEAYFASDLYADLARRRADIRRYATDRYSWDVVSDATSAVYDALAGAAPPRRP
jgi:glycosyltransferase involved in cell wall biosynthesis